MLIKRDPNLSFEQRFPRLAAMRAGSGQPAAAGDDDDSFQKRFPFFSRLGQVIRDNPTATMQFGMGLLSDGWQGGIQGLNTGHQVDEERRQQTQADQDAETQRQAALGLVGALPSLPGGIDPTLLVNAAGPQAATQFALGQLAPASSTAPTLHDFYDPTTGTTVTKAWINGQWVDQGQAPPTGDAASPTTAQRDYGFYVQNLPAGQKPLSFNDWQHQPNASSPPTPTAAALRGEVQSLPSYKNYSAALPIYLTMVDAFPRNTRASDLNLVYGLAKIFDPGSVVREGEQVLVQNTASLPDWLLGSINSVNGGAALQPDTRRDMMTEAQSRMNSYEDAYGADRQTYEGLAERNSLNPDDVFGPMYDLPDWNTPDTGGGGPVASVVPMAPAPNAGATGLVPAVPQPPAQPTAITPAQSAALPGGYTNPFALASDLHATVDAWVQAGHTEEEAIAAVAQQLGTTPDVIEQWVMGQ